jgi:hypothetical protein
MLGQEVEVRAFLKPHFFFDLKKKEIVHFKVLDILTQIIVY